VGPRAGLVDLEKRKLLSLPGLNSDPSIIQPIAVLTTLFLLLFHSRKVRKSHYTSLLEVYLNSIFNEMGMQILYKRTTVTFIVASTRPK
jgi:hypothetical protein